MKPAAYQTVRGMKVAVQAAHQTTADYYVEGNNFKKINVIFRDRYIKRINQGRFLQTYPENSKKKPKTSGKMAF